MNTPEAYENLGRDLVAAVAGDIVVMGAKPLTFLDYLGVHRVDPEVIEALVRGMSGRLCGGRDCACRRRDGGDAPLCMPKVIWM